MNFAIPLLYLGAGAAAGAIYLALLWLTANALVRRRGIMPLFLGSVTRFGFLASLCLAVFWARTGPLELISGLVGFLIVRLIVLCAIPAGVQHSKTGSI